MTTHLATIVFRAATWRAVHFASLGVAVVIAAVCAAGILYLAFRRP